jgi:hypothetical protein
VAAEVYLFYNAKFRAVICAKGNYYKFFTSECG